MWNIENKIEPTYGRSQKYSIQINKNYVNESKVEPIVFAPSVDQWTKKGLEAVENKHISEFADKYEDRVLNKRNNPNKRRRLESMSKLKQYWVTKN